MPGDRDFVPMTLENQFDLLKSDFIRKTEIHLALMKTLEFPQINQADRLAVLSDFHKQSVLSYHNLFMLIEKLNSG